MKNFFKKNGNIIIVLLLLFLVFIFIDDIIDKSVIGNTPYNSYELQARAWLNGQTYLDHDYPYLELAIYNNHYYVSFPPFPSVILLPLVIFFKTIPANLLMFFMFAMEIVILYKILKRYNNSEFVSIILALAFTVGTSLMSLAVDSGVWFIAQILNNLLCVLALNAFLNDKKTLVYFYLALAVGCRPFSAIYMVMFFIYYLIKEKDIDFLKRLLNNLKPVIPAVIVALLYMSYNYIRFGNVLEFGHNYLPEFTRAIDGQFSLNYLLKNLGEFFFNPIHIDSKLNLSFPFPFCFFIANPITIVYVYKSIINIFKTKKIDILRIMIFVSIIINIIAICLHKTLGGWQFGSRYACDFLPFIFLALLLFDKKKKVNLNKFDIFCIVFGIILNIFGVIILYTDKLF